jgi:hypothetical protein
MKYLFSLLVMTSITTSPAILAEEAAPAPAATEIAASDENNNSSLAELCSTYAEEDGIAASKKAAYIQDCMSNMTDLSESMQEGLPLMSDEAGETVAAPSSGQVNTPEKLVQNELVETPDPAAEQLTAGK